MSASQSPKSIGPAREIAVRGVEDVKPVHAEH